MDVIPSVSSASWRFLCDRWLSASAVISCIRIVFLCDRWLRWGSVVLILCIRIVWYWHYLPCSLYQTYLVHDSGGGSTQEGPFRQFHRKGPMIGSKKHFSTLRESWPSTECTFMPKFWIVIALVTGYLFFMDIPRSCLLDYIPRGLIWLGALYRDGHLRYCHTNGTWCYASWKTGYSQPYVNLGRPLSVCSCLRSGYFG